MKEMKEINNALPSPLLATLRRIKRYLDGGRVEREQIPDSLFDTVSGYIRFARRYHARYLIQWLWVMVLNDKLTEADYRCCLKVLEDVGHLVGRNYETDDDQTSDIIYESFVLVGMIYAKREELRDNPVILSWKTLAEDEEVFNDQRMGWRKGKNAII